MDNLGYLIMKVSKEIKYLLMLEMKRCGFTPSQWAVLKRLEMEEKLATSLDHRTAVELAAKLDLDKPTISGIVRRLVEKGMIRKDPHPKDKRASILLLTQEAKEIIPKLETISNDVIEHTVSSFSPEEKERLMTLLKKLDNELSKEER